MTRKEVSKRYENDDNEAPRFGYKVKWDRWRWEHKGAQGLSVNCAKCLPAPECSILLDPHVDRHDHVVELDIAPLSELIGMPIVAVYEPILPDDDCEGNVCHFDVLPLDNSLEEIWQAIRAVLEAPTGEPSWPRKLPSTSEEVEAATKLAERYRAAFRVIKTPHK